MESINNEPANINPVEPKHNLGRGWVVLIFVIVIGLIVCGAYAYKKYKDNSNKSVSTVSNSAATSSTTGSTSQTGSSSDQSFNSDLQSIDTNIKSLDTESNSVDSGLNDQTTNLNL